MFKRFRIALPAAVLAVTAMAAPADAQRRGGQTGDRDVSATARTSGSGSGGTVALDGSANAAATDGGEVNTRVRGRTTDRRGMIMSTATARDEDERARSRSRTIVNPRGDVRTMTRDMYHRPGSRPVIERSRTNSRRDD